MRIAQTCDFFVKLQQNFCQRKNTCTNDYTLSKANTHTILLRYYLSQNESRGGFLLARSAVNQTDVASITPTFRVPRNALALPVVCKVRNLR